MLSLKAEHLGFWIHEAGVSEYITRYVHRILDLGFSALRGLSP